MIDKRIWLEDPQRITEINASPILPTTLRALRMIATSYHKKGMRPIWRTTYFQNLIVVARVLENSHKLVLSDNTDILIHQMSKAPSGPQILIKHQYYRFIFQITPYTADSLAILKIQRVSTEEIGAHLSQVIQQELIGQLHRQLLQNQSENQKSAVNCIDKKQQILNAIGNRAKFTLQELQREVECDSTLLGEILEELCGQGKIGDMGKQYIVIEHATEEQ